MSDVLKLFIQQNRQDFDVEAPALAHWKGVATTLDRLRNAGKLEIFIAGHRTDFDQESPSDVVWIQIVEQLETVSPLEQFIQQHREAFDEVAPDLRVWSEVAGALPQPKARIVPLGWHRHLLRAAASVALLVIGLGAGIWYAKNFDESSMTMADVSAEYGELEKYYERDINNKKEKLAVFTGSQSADVMQDLEQLDRVMEELREELAHVPPANRQQVVRAMIENYKAKAAILERVLEHLDATQTPGNNQLKNDVKNI
ncbi:MAG: hypothetical protein JNJ57_03290 [Saprospiraceae bacterium]|nr:hypothetical protein [Saprospiraceae bacterium]